MSARRRGPRRQASQALVAFAFSVPLFLLLLLGMIDFSRAMFTYMTLVNSTREMARSLSVPSTPNATAIAAFQNVAVVLGPTDPATDLVTVAVYSAGGTQQGTTVSCTMPLSASSCTVPARTGNDGGWIEVMETYSFKFAPQFRAPFNVSFLEPTAVLTSTARAYIE